MVEGGGGRRKETKVNEKANGIKNADNIIYLILVIKNHSRYILLDAVKYTSKPDINV
jgi:hypothetical protein